MPTVLASFGGGVNSTAMLIGMIERKEPAPLAILFADTGGEHPHTYAHIERFSLWLEKQGYPPISAIKKGGREETLEESCRRLNVLPSVAYGYKTCSQKYKVEPQEKWANNNAACRATWNAKGKVVKLIGFDAGEPQRAKFTSDAKYTWRYPLLEWDWGREECIDAITRSGLPQPGKSSCFFCPHMRKAEILDLQRQYPDLLGRALAMEAAAKLSTVKGLGRRFAWRDFLAASEQEKLATPDISSVPCDCYDGVS